MTDIVEMLRLVRKFLGERWRLVVLAAMCGAAIGYFLTFAVHPTFWAKATLYIAPPVSTSATDAVAGDQYAQERTQLYWQLATSDELARRVVAEMKSVDAPAAVAKRIKVSFLHEAPLLTIQATGQSADAARLLAQAYVDQLPDYARSVEQNSGLRDGPVEQNSGLREGIVLMTVARPVEVTKSTAGVKPWLKVLLSTALFGGAALIYTMLKRRRHPTVRGVGQLRKAVPEPWAMQVDGSPGEMARLQAMLFAAPNSARKVILAGARSEDGVDEIIAEFRTALQGRLNDVEVFAGPALLDQHERITALAARSFTGIMISAISSVIVCLKGQTLLEDVVDLVELLSANGVDVKGILITRRRKREKRRVSWSPRAVDTDEPRPRIDVIECGRPSQNGNKAAF